MAAEIFGWRATAGPCTSQEIIEEFQNALREEKYAKDHGAGNSKISLTNGRRVNSDRIKTVYRFLLDRDLTIEDDMPIDILIGDKKAPGYVVSSDEESISLAFEQSFGDYIQKATLITSETKLLDDLIAKYDQVKSGKIAFNHEGCLRLFGVKKSEEFAVSSTAVDVSPYSPPPNIQQTEAIQSAFTRPVTYIWGPPGTGKTKTLGIILDQLLQRKKSVLLVSHTNLAVDEILLKYASIEASRSYIEEGKILRIGTPGKDDPILNQLTVDNVIQRLAKEPIEQRNVAIDEKKALESRLVALKNSGVLEHVRQYEDYIKAAGSFTSQITHYEKNLETAKQAETAYQEQKGRLQEKITELENASFFRKILSGNSLESLHEEISRTERQIGITNGEVKALFSKKQELARKQHEAESSSHSLKRAVESIVQANGVTFPSDLTRLSIQKIFDSFASAIDEKRKEIERLTAEIEAIKNNLIKNALVVGCTLTKVFLDQKLYSCQFHTLILDEASMATLPSVYFAGGLISQKTNHYIISGDFRQLSPIAVSATPLAQKWLKRDIFKHAGIVDSANCTLEDERLVMLRVQHRMHPVIVELINKSMYNGELRSAPEVLESKSRITALAPFENHPLILIDTSAINPWSNRPKYGSKINLYTAILVSQLVGRIFANEGSISNLGIISPYRLQAKLISDLLDEQNIPRKKAVAATVHKFQGNERNGIIIDLVDGPPFNAGLPVIGNFLESEAGKLINVAVSRAEGKLVLVANVGFLMNFSRSKLSDDDAIIQVIKDIQKNGLVIDSRQLLPSYFDGNSPRFAKTGITISEHDSLSLWNEENFYSVFLQDLRNARERVVIYSPFIGKNRLGMMMDPLRTVRERGIPVFLITRKPEFQGSNKESTPALIDDVKKMGLDIILAGNEVGLNEQFHEKIALIDNSGFYHGSLNILSQSESSESMMVYRSPATIEQLVKFFDIESVLRRYSRIGAPASPRAPADYAKVSSPAPASVADSGKNQYSTKKTSTDHPSLFPRIAEAIKKQYTFSTCEKCNGELIVINNIDHMVLECAHNKERKCNFSLIVPDNTLQNAFTSLRLPCDRCGTGTMRYRRSQYGPFIACNKYPSCRNVIDFKRMK